MRFNTSTFLTAHLYPSVLLSWVFLSKMVWRTSSNPFQSSCRGSNHNIKLWPWRIINCDAFKSTLKARRLWLRHCLKCSTVKCNPPVTFFVFLFVSFFTSRNWFDIDQTSTIFLQVLFYMNTRGWLFGGNRFDVIFWSISDFWVYELLVWLVNEPSRFPAK